MLERGADEGFARAREAAGGWPGLTPFRMISLAINLLILWYLVARYLRKREARHAQEVPQAAGSGILAHDPASPLVIGTDGRHRSRSSA
jgi:hypothetical protein